MELNVGRAVRQALARRRFRGLFDAFQGFPLTEDQRRAATSFARETLVVAGAGSGKTSLLLARAKYLLESGRATPEQILFLAFNRKAAEGIGQRSEQLGLDLRASTFHAFGNSILKEHLGTKAVVFTEDHEIDQFIRARLRELTTRPGEANRISTFLTTSLVPTRTPSSFTNLNDYSAYVQGMPQTMQGERVKSHGEWMIANFLWNNSVQYQYEALYRAGDRSDVHKPDFTVANGAAYVEYFGVDAHGNTAPGIDPDHYAKLTRWKREVHARNRTTLIEVTYQDLLDHQLLKKVASALTQHGVKLAPRPTEQILAQADASRYMDRLVSTSKTFLQHVRALRLDLDDLATQTLDERSLQFLEIFTVLHAAYVDELEDLGQPDFSELIHGGADRIAHDAVQLPFTHVMVDEFQDIAQDRLTLIEALRTSNPKIQITLVGDDWQAIYGFAGSDIDIMLGFAKRGRSRSRVDLRDTFRLPQTLADAATTFITENPRQLRKRIRSSFDTETPLVLHWDTSSRQADLITNVEAVIERIGDASNDPDASLYVLARYRNNLPTQAQLKRLWAGNAAADTIHSVKGLEADYVIVTDVMQDFRGFPSTITDDPVLQLVRPDRDTYPYAEERRLLYVALTRARVQTHLISPADKPSLFALELEDPRFQATHVGREATMECPLCDGGVIAKNAWDNYSCSNRPLCTFVTPVCPDCRRYTQITAIDPLTYACSDHPEITFDPCPLCTAGALVERTGKFGAFKSCHLWPVTNCEGR